MAVNLRRQKTTLKAAAASGRLSSEVNVLFEKRRVRATSGRLVDEIEPLGVRVYSIRLTGRRR
jgi:hypothetical protein